LRWPHSAASVLACILLFLIPVRRRRWLAMFSCSLLLFAVASCGGNKNTGSTGPPPNPGTTPGTYTVTITGVSGSLTETGTVALTVQ
jgi:hypothetical protein